LPFPDTVYFGDLGEEGAVMKDYFARNGISCPEDANPAEVSALFASSLFANR